MNNKTKIFDFKTIGILLGLFLLLVGSTITLLKFRFNIFFGTTNSGEIGDTIGGITGPIINLFGALLVYKSFVVQLEANKLQVENYENDKMFRDLWELYKETKSDIENYEYLAVHNNHHNIVFKGIHGIERLMEDVDKAFNIFKDRRFFKIYELISVLKGIELTYLKISTSKLDTNDKQLILIKMNNLFNEHLVTKLSNLGYIFSQKCIQNSLTNYNDDIDVVLKNIIELKNKCA